MVLLTFVLRQFLRIARGNYNFVLLKLCKTGFNSCRGILKSNNESCVFILDVMIHKNRNPVYFFIFVFAKLISKLINSAKIGHQEINW